jgi:hypothetical protein
MQEGEGRVVVGWLVGLGWGGVGCVCVLGGGPCSHADKPSTQALLILITSRWQSLTPWGTTRGVARTGCGEALDSDQC